VSAPSFQRTGGGGGSSGVSRSLSFTGTEALTRRLKTGMWPCAMILFGDSTGNGNDEWFYLLGQNLASRFPAYRTRYQLWSDPAQAYAPPSYLSTGTGLRRSITVPANSGINLQTPNTTALTITGDIDVRATITIDTMPPGQNVDVCGKTASAGNRSWWMSITTTGFLQFSWSNDGTATLSQTSSVAIPAGAKSLRAFLDVDNGAAQYSVTFYTSTDWDGGGGTWNQLGAVRTGATGITSIFAGTSTTQFVSRSNGTWPVPGSAFALQVWSGAVMVIDLDMGALPSLATSVTDYLGNPWTLIGAPARTGDLHLQIFNASVVSESVSYANDGTRFPKLTPYPADLSLISYGHNETGTTYPGYSTLTTALLAKWPGVQIVPVLQNPELTPGRTQAQVDAHAMRMDLVATLAAQNRWTLIDAYRAFVDSGRALIDVLPDGLHPNADGSAIWADAAVKAFTGRY